MKIALTGNRYSGKNTVAKEFEKIGVSVFNADVVTKFMLHYDMDIVRQIEIELGKNIFDERGFVNLNLLNTNEKFNRLIDIIEPYLFDAYRKFNEKNNQHIYTIFLSSMIFERQWSKKFNATINVFAPRIIRMERAMSKDRLSFLQSNALAGKEIDELEKNKLSDYIIHSYDFNMENLTMQIEKINDKIVRNYVQTKMMVNEKN
jgi:dephospho-CoA kinase